MKKMAKKIHRPAQNERIPVRVQYGPHGPSLVELGYGAATEIRRSGRAQPIGGSGDYHLRFDLELLRAASQQFDRENGLYHGLINRALDNILGYGFVFQARTSSKRTNTKLESLWAEFVEAPEVRGLDHWCEIERLALRHYLVDGDVGAIKISGDVPDAGGKIQLIEGERIYDPSASLGGGIEGGIRLNKYGRPISFSVCGYDSSGFIQRGNPTIVPADAFVFMSKRNRISQTRGVPAQVTNFPMFHRINDVCDSEAVSWQILSRLAVAVSKRDAASMADIVSSENSNRSDQPPNLDSRYVDMGDAVVFFGEPGETISGIDRNVPGANFTNSITTFMRLLGLPLGMPLELVLLDWSKTSYSSARAALEQAYRNFKAIQNMLKQKWHSKIYRWKVSQWISEGMISPISSIYDHEWFAPPFPWIDQLKEVKAAGESVDRGYYSYSDALKQLNKDREEYIVQRSVEIEEAIQAAEIINAKHPSAAVPWQVFAGLDVNKVQKQVAIDANESEDESNTQTKADTAAN